MKAETTTGAIIDLVQDCECITHTGPHWLHDDAITRAANLELLDYAERLAATAQTMADANYIYAVGARFAEVEIVRLDAKRREMQRLGIVRLVE